MFAFALLSFCILSRHTCGNELWVPFCDSEEELASASEHRRCETTMSLHGTFSFQDVTHGLTRRIIAILLQDRTFQIFLNPAAIRFKSVEPTVVV